MFLRWLGSRVCGDFINYCVYYPFIFGVGYLLGVGLLFSTRIFSTLQANFSLLHFFIDIGI